MRLRSPKEAFDSVARLQLAGLGNAGNAVTQRLKWATKLHRARGVHVTPTVHVNGLEASIASSDWTVEEWKAFLAALQLENSHVWWLKGPCGDLFGARGLACSDFGAQDWHLNKTKS